MAELTPPCDTAGGVSRVSIEVSEKLYQRLQAEVARTGDSLDIVAEQAILRTLSARKKPDAGTCPALNCEGCKRITFHTYVGQKFASGGMEQIYGCNDCHRPRRWGLLGIGKKHEDED
jgi:hypothetical protein